MDIQFLGAAEEVTGSCYLIRVGKRLLLLECGLIQGAPKDEARNRESFPFDPSAIDAVVLSHSHIDHSGRLPLLVKAGFRGRIFAQRACVDLCEIMLRDSAYLQEKDTAHENRRRQRKGLDTVEPLYTVRDARRAMRRFEALPYGERVPVVEGVDLRLRDAGHILGSAIVELWLTEGGTTRKLVFSGDLGHAGAPILRDPERIEDADLVLLESTYGDRLHRSRQATKEELQNVLEAALSGKGNVLIPAFAVGRTQELLYLMAENHAAWGMDRWRIFLDSPLAIEATEVYARHSELYDAQARREFARDQAMPLPPTLRFSRTPQQSMAINRIEAGAIIIAGSGMCNGGRIKHHLKHNVWRRDCQVVIVGYQAAGTIGRRLVDGASRIRLFGETVRVNAKIHTIGGFSAHADQAGLTAWYRNFEARPPVVLVHGERPAAERLAQVLALDGPRPRIARRGERLDLSESMDKLSA